MKIKNYYKRLILFAFILIFSNASVLFAQKVVASLDTTSIRIGERVQLRLNATLPKTATIYWPSITDTLSKSIEVASKSKVDTNATSRQDFTNYNQSIVITSFDTGFHYIPPFVINYSYSGDTSRHELLSEGVYLKVRLVEVDTTQSIRDIKGPIQAPISFEELAPFIAGLAVLGILVTMVWYYFWRKRMNKPLFPIAVKVQGPPWQIALQDLDNLEKERLWQMGKLKEYYSILTDILRQYLHDQHKIDAMELTTGEILSAYDSSGLKADSRHALSYILTQADYVKFAKATPGKSENEQSLKYGRIFIEATKPSALVNATPLKEISPTPEIEQR